MARIVYRDENYQTFYVDVNDQHPEVTIGRNQGNMIMIPTKSLSRYHAKIIYQNHRYFLLDLKSSNGSYVNNQRVTQQEIHPGDKIRLGDVGIEFIDDNRGMGGPSSAPMPPRPAQINTMPQPQQNIIGAPPQKPLNAPKIQFGAGANMPNMAVPDMRSVNMRPISGGGTYRPTMPNQPAFDDDMAKLAASQVASPVMPDANAAPNTFNPMGSGFAPNMPGMSGGGRAPSLVQPPPAMGPQSGGMGPQAGGMAMPPKPQLPDPNVAPNTFNPMSSGYVQQMNPAMGQPNSPRVSPAPPALGRGGGLPDASAAPGSFNPASGGFAPSRPAGEFSGMPTLPMASNIQKPNAAPQSFDPMGSGLVSQMMPSGGAPRQPSGAQPGPAVAGMPGTPGSQMNMNPATSGLPDPHAAPQSFDPMVSGLVSQMMPSGGAPRQPSGAQPRPAVAGMPGTPGSQMNMNPATSGLLDPHAAPLGFDPIGGGLSAQMMPSGGAALSVGGLPDAGPALNGFDPLASGVLPKFSGNASDSMDALIDSGSETNHFQKSEQSSSSVNAGLDQVKEDAGEEIPPARRAGSAAAFARRPSRANSAYNRAVSSEISHAVSANAASSGNAQAQNNEASQIPAPLHNRGRAAPRGRMPMAPKNSEAQDKSAHEHPASQDEAAVSSPSGEVIASASHELDGGASPDVPALEEHVSGSAAIEPDRDAQPVDEPLDFEDDALRPSGAENVSENLDSNAREQLDDIGIGRADAEIVNPEASALAKEALAAANKRADDAENELNALRAELDSLKTENDTQIEHIRAEHAKEIAELKNEQNKALDSLKAEYAKELDSLKAEHAKALSEAKEEQLEALSQLRAEGDEIADDLRKDNDDLQHLCDKQQDELQTLKDKLKTIEDADLKKNEFLPLWKKRFEEMLDYANALENAVLDLNLNAQNPQAEEYVHSMADVLRFCLDDLH